MTNSETPSLSFSAWFFSWNRAFWQATQGMLMNYGAVLKRSYGRLTALIALQGAAGQFFTFALEVLRESGREDIGSIAMIAILELIFTLAWSSAWTLILCHEMSLKQEKVAAPAYQDFNQLMIEQVRALASVLWRLPLLILPALLEYVRLAFVPYVVMLDPEYRTGHVDALVSSRQLTRGHFVLITSVVLLSLILPWLTEEWARGNAGPYVWENPIGVGLGWAFSLVLNLASTLFMIHLYRHLRFS